MNRQTRQPLKLKVRNFVAAATLALATCSAAAAPASYQIDSDHLSVGFLVDHIGYAKTLGMFRSASGSFKFDEQALTLSDIEIKIKTDSVFTNHRKRDKHLRSADFLNSAEFPEMTFRAATAERTGDRSFSVPGQLSLLGTTKSVTLTATWNKSAQYPIGDKPYVTGVSIRGSFNRSDFAMNYAVANEWVGDEIELIIELEAQRQ